MKLSSGIFRIIIVFGLLCFLSLVIAQEDVDRAVSVDPGILPDSLWYGMDVFWEEMMVGDDPERALAYREEKIAEARAMARERMAEQAQEALGHASQYRDIVEREVTPDMERRMQKSYDTAKMMLDDVSEDLPQLQGEITEQLSQEERVVFAAKVARNIHDLCETLAKLDTIQYGKICKASEDAPQWRKQQDEELTEQQKEQAQHFAAALRECYESDGEQCDCQELGISSFTELCTQKVQELAACRAGEKNACIAMAQPMEWKEHVPDYLWKEVESVVGKKRGSFSAEDAEEKQLVPGMCEQAGVSSMEECQELVMKRGYDKGEQMGYVPLPCREEGITSMKECVTWMKSRFNEKGNQGEAVGQPERIAEYGRDCHALQDYSEKAACFQQNNETARKKYE
ncbi:MAG: hypothetical protein AABX37_01335, partial [Nanoarchaeota archaeon]